jgi:hypothetical protein
MKRPENTEIAKSETETVRDLTQFIQNVLNLIQEILSLAPNIENYPEAALHWNEFCNTLGEISQQVTQDSTEIDRFFQIQREVSAAIKEFESSLKHDKVDFIFTVYFPRLENMAYQMTDIFKRLSTTWKINFDHCKEQFTKLITIIGSHTLRDIENQICHFAKSILELEHNYITRIVHRKIQKIECSLRDKKLLREYYERLTRKFQTMRKQVSALESSTHSLQYCKEQLNNINERSSTPTENCKRNYEERLSQLKEEEKQLIEEKNAYQEKRKKSLENESSEYILEVLERRDWERFKQNLEALDRNEISQREVESEMKNEINFEEKCYEIDKNFTLVENAFYERILNEENSESQNPTLSFRECLEKGMRENSEHYEHINLQISDLEDQLALHAIEESLSRKRHQKNIEERNRELQVVKHQRNSVVSKLGANDISHAGKLVTKIQQLSSMLQSNLLKFSSIVNQSERLEKSLDIFFKMMKNAFNFDAGIQNLSEEDFSQGQIIEWVRKTYSTAPYNPRIEKNIREFGLTAPFLKEIVDDNLFLRDKLGLTEKTMRRVWKEKWNREYEEKRLRINECIRKEVLETLNKDLRRLLEWTGMNEVKKKFESGFTSRLDEGEKKQLENLIDARLSLTTTRIMENIENLKESYIGKILDLEIELQALQQTMNKIEVRCNGISKLFAQINGLKREFIEFRETVEKKEREIFDLNLKVKEIQRVKKEVVEVKEIMDKRDKEISDCKIKVKEIQGVKKELAEVREILEKKDKEISDYKLKVKEIQWVKKEFVEIRAILEKKDNEISNLHLKIKEIQKEKEKESQSMSEMLSRICDLENSKKVKHQEIPNKVIPERPEKNPKNKNFFSDVNNWFGKTKKKQDDMLKTVQPVNHESRHERDLSPKNEKNNTSLIFTSIRKSDPVTESQIGKHDEKESRFYSTTQKKVEFSFYSKRDKTRSKQRAKSHQVIPRKG